MSAYNISEEIMDQLHSPLHWADVKFEDPAVTELKIRRAKELGVVAVLFTDEQVMGRVSDLAKIEQNRVGTETLETIYVSVMSGGIPLSAALMRELASRKTPIHPVADYIDASRYKDSQTPKNKPDIIRHLRPETDLNGKRVVLIDDVIEGSVTLGWLGATARDPATAHLLGKGVTGPAATTGLITLVDKQIALPEGFDAKSVSVGLVGPKVWLGGGGMDDGQETYRWTPEIIITPVQEKKFQLAMEEVLSILGERAVMGMDDITWI